MYINEEFMIIAVSTPRKSSNISISCIDTSRVYFIRPNTEKIFVAFWHVRLYLVIISWKRCGFLLITFLCIEFYSTIELCNLIFIPFLEKLGLTTLHKFWLRFFSGLFLQLCHNLKIYDLYVKEFLYFFP